jgi:hypothetical protein
MYMYMYTDTNNVLIQIQLQLFSVYIRQRRLFSEINYLPGKYTYIQTLVYGLNLYI